MTQQRVQSGIPTGGQFAAAAHTESGVTLAGQPDAPVKARTVDPQVYSRAYNHAQERVGVRPVDQQRQALDTVTDPAAFARWHTSFGVDRGLDVEHAWEAFSGADEQTAPATPDDPSFIDDTGRDTRIDSLTYEMDDEEDPVILAAHAGHEHPWVRQSVAGNPSTLQSTLRRLMRDEAPVVRRNVAANLTDPADLRELTSDADMTTAKAAESRLRSIRRRDRAIKDSAAEAWPDAKQRRIDGNDEQSGWVEEADRRRYVKLLRSAQISFVGDGRIDCEMTGPERDLHVWGSDASDLLDAVAQSDKIPDSALIVQRGPGRYSLIWS